MKPPVAKQKPVRIEQQGETREDAYAWLRDADWQAVMRDPGKLDPEIRAYLEAENAYTEASLAPVEGLKQTLFAELKARIKQDESSVPVPDGEWSYYRRYRTGGQHPLFCRRQGEAEQLMLDGDAEATRSAFFKVAQFAHAPDQTLAAYSVDLNGSERYLIRVRDLASGQDLPDILADAHGDFAWGADGRTLYYTELDDNHRPARVRRHRLGEPPADAPVIYEESDPGFFVGVSSTPSRRFVMIDAHDHETSEVRLLDAADPSAMPRLVAARDSRVEYEAGDHSDRLLILTNANDAEDFKIVEAPLASPERAQWRDLVPHQPGRLILSLLLFKRHMVRLERVEGLPRIVVTRLADGDEHMVSFDEDAYSLSVSQGLEFDTDRLRFVYSSLGTPERTYDYDMTTRERTLRKEQEVPSGHDPARYVSRRVFAKAHDGELVPVSLLYRRDVALDGSAPLLLYGYGAYGHAIPAGFSTSRFSLVDRGFVYAIAHIRGGKDKGYRWYREGKAAAKPNTFKDFIAAAEHLIAERFSSAGRIVAQGGSAGGMLMGAIANMRPDLFGAVVAEVPFVDVLNTMSDPTLPLTPPEWPEWGNPIEDAAAYKTIRAYSPYENVSAQAYPPLLVLAGLTDPRVTYWEPAKWVARLRALKTDDHLLLLKTNMAAGHGGAAGRFDRLEEVALTFAFVLMAMGRV